jgi:hypothetical protein
MLLVGQFRLGVNLMAPAAMFGVASGDFGNDVHAGFLDWAGRGE